MRDGVNLHSQLSAATVRAETDALTGIGNRLRLSRELQEAIAESQSFGLLFLDLKRFKPFNDDHGHEVGDKVLQIVARRIQAQIRSQDLAARLGGDEFIVMLAELADVDLLEQRAENLAKSLSRRFHIGDLSSQVGVNIGGAIYPRDGDSEAKLLKVADENMYRAKKTDTDFFVSR